MPRGQPDYGIYTEADIAGGMSDVGEGAARLKSIDTYDRRGWVYYLDDFESPAFAWGTGNAFGGSTPVHDSTYCVSGSQVVKLACDAAANAYSYITRYFGFIRTGRLGIEIKIQGDFTTTGYFQFLIEVLNGVTDYTGSIKYDGWTGTITLVHNGGSTEVATGIYMDIGSTHFVPIKLVIDIDSGTFVRLIAGGKEYDLSAYDLVDGGATTNEVIQVKAYLKGRAAATSAAYLDDFILTFNEP